MVFLETREAVGMQPAGALRGHMLSFSISLEAAATAVGGASCHRYQLSPTRHRDLDDGGTPAAPLLSEPACVLRQNLTDTVPSSNETLSRW